MLISDNVFVLFDIRRLYIVLISDNVFVLFDILWLYIM